MMDMKEMQWTDEDKAKIKRRHEGAFYLDAETIVWMARLEAAEQEASEQEKLVKDYLQDRPLGWSRQDALLSGRHPLPVDISDDGNKDEELILGMLLTRFGEGICLPNCRNTCTDATGVAEKQCDDGVESSFLGDAIGSPAAVCEPGTTWDAVSAACKPCPHGSFSSAPNAPSCTPCPAGQYAPNEGSTSCTACPQFATTPSQGSYLAEACICQPGYYALDSVCEVCAEGAECLGGNLMKARAGWCEVPPTDEAGSVASFLHCCRPEECTGGVGATCDASIATVGVEDCAVRYLSWDTIHLVSLSDATWVTIGVILALLLTIFFCCGLALGWKRALKRFEKQIAPQLAAGGLGGDVDVDARATHSHLDDRTTRLPGCDLYCGDELQRIRYQIKVVCQQLHIVLGLFYVRDEVKGIN